ncbi:hypothetical protein [Phenylobacterium sp.]|uniref:hypothetical protein n=1 Tax=Phenylobacterium sp. TaxID=1871053 RepID=UPI00273558F5|nr:hypothetical protein [Phenylobacterium sp.]MDP3659187.1 hypothetical protein [Phenylobacterium sp.]
MIRNSLLAGLATVSILAGTAHAQGVEVAPLAAPDLFSTGGRDTGLPADLWRGASARTLGAVLPLIATKPLSPASAALARRVLATGANGPQGAGQDRTMAGLRANALIAAGDLQAGSAILARTAGVERDPALSQAAAEAALLSGDNTRACAVADALNVGRDEAYWLRLRAFCQALAGQAGAAQLTFELAQTQARDAVYGRLMGAKLAGAGDPGQASLRNGLDYALSRSLGLDLAAAKASPAIASALSTATPGAAFWPMDPGVSDVGAALAALGAGDLARAQAMRAAMVQDQIPNTGPVDLAILDAAIAAATGAADGPTLDRLVERGGMGEAKARVRAQSAALLLAALGSPLGPDSRGELAAFTAGESKAPAARALALELAGEQKLLGESAMLALWTAADAGAAGPALGDRVRIVRALRAAGLEADARAFALEGLLALR